MNVLDQYFMLNRCLLTLYTFSFDTFRREIIRPRGLSLVNLGPKTYCTGLEMLLASLWSDALGVTVV